MTTFSIITVCLNSAATIEAAIKSVVRQNAADVEHIVIDGGSTDGTLELIAKYPHLKLISEPDRGVYDAMNKGLGKAEGAFVLFLNADDWLEEGLLEAARPLLLDGPDCLCIGADIRRRDVEGAIEIADSFTTTDTIDLKPKNMVLGTPLLNAKVFRTDFLRGQVGLFDLQYKIASDVDFLWRAATAKPRVKLMEQLGYHYIEHDQSLTMNARDANGIASAIECYAIADHHLNQPGLSAVERLVLRALRGGKFTYLLRRKAHGQVAFSWGQIAGDLAFYGAYLVFRRIALLWSALAPKRA